MIDIKPRLRGFFAKYNRNNGMDMKSFKDLTRKTELQKLKASGGKPKSNIPNETSGKEVEPGSSPESWITWGSTGIGGVDYAIGADWNKRIDEGNAAEEAHARGLESAGWGKWKDKKTGKVVAKTVNGGTPQEKLEPMKLDDDAQSSSVKDGESQSSGQISDAPARKQGGKDPKGGDSKKFVEILEALGNPAIAQGNAKGRAASMGLQSDGHGGYVNADGKRVAETVNGELVFFDPQGGATDDSNSPSPILPQAQVDPFSGLIKVPGAKMDSSVMQSQGNSSLPAKAPIGYDQMLDKIRNTRMESIPQLQNFDQ